MGHPRRIAKKYSTPKHPWRAERIQEENRLQREYGLKNKKEIWKAHAYLRDIRRQARKLLALRTRQAEVERTQLINRLVRLGLLKGDEGIDEILALTTTDILDRRLQTIVYKKGLSATINQARQFIVHGHVAIGGQRVTAPSYLVRVDEEKDIKLLKNLKPKAAKEKKAQEKKEEEGEPGG
ncbi:MAG: 30S ribosomal protein S4 [Methanobacteriota archaeon]|nr:MAG: 30S ribosomal protein S4 [Euryarchaeota archaeon]